ncbi:MAG: hypothetical protein K6A90_02380, partial [Lachnospiraceae bacterium]|nr:hypothetical protein [Lachnospiraceae bacterium]
FSADNNSILINFSLLLSHVYLTKMPQMLFDVFHAFFLTLWLSVCSCYLKNSRCGKFYCKQLRIILYDYPLIKDMGEGKRKKHS